MCSTWALAKMDLTNWKEREELQKWLAKKETVSLAATSAASAIWSWAGLGWAVGGEEGQALWPVRKEGLPLEEDSTHYFTCVVTSI